jgi:hypothetical protein
MGSRHEAASTEIKVIDRVSEVFSAALDDGLIAQPVAS